MRINTKDLIEEIQEITTVDGFIASCLEIKESMFFYDRDLMLAAYSASLEFLTVTALLGGAFQSEQILIEIEGEVANCAGNLLKDLGIYEFPLDIQYVVDHYLQTYGLQTSLSIPVYSKMIRYYTSPAEDEATSLDSLVVNAHYALDPYEEQLSEKCISYLAQIGAKMLQGANLRPIWLQISHPHIQHILLGLQTLMNNCRITPYFNFPLDKIDVERQKRKKIKGSVVLDLDTFRKFREGGSGYTKLNVATFKDGYDYFLEGLQDDLSHLDLEPDQEIITLINFIFQTYLVSQTVDQELLSRLIVYCDRWQISEVAHVVIEILASLPPHHPLFYRFWSLLKSFESKALPAVRHFVRSNPNSPFLSYLSIFLSTGNKGKRKWSLLTEIFEQYEKEDEEKVEMANSIARFGGSEAVDYLEKALAQASTGNRFYREGLEQALTQARQNED